MVGLNDGELEGLGVGSFVGFAYFVFKQSTNRKKLDSYARERYCHTYATKLYNTHGRLGRRLHRRFR